MAAGSGRQIGSDYATAIEPGRLMRPGTNDVENFDLGRRLPLANPMHASACRRWTLQSCRSVLGQTRPFKDHFFVAELTGSAGLQ